MNANLFVAFGLAAAAWAGAHEYTPRQDRGHGPIAKIEVRPEHREFEQARFAPVEDRRDGWRREEARHEWREDHRDAWRHEEWRREGFQEPHRPAPVLVVERSYRPEPALVVVSEPGPVRGSVSINW